MAKSVLLIVVDNPAHRVLFNKYLKTTPHSLMFATDGEEAFDRFAEVKPDLVLAHVNASRLDGKILCQLIRQQPTGPVLPFVLMGEEFVDPKPVGADAFLPIPFSKSMLVQCITPLLAFGRPADEDSGVHPPPLWADADPPTAPIPERREETDLDTVVSFKNPFYRPELEATDEFGAMLENPDGPLTELHPDDEPLESSRKLADPADRKQVQSSEEATTGPDLTDPIAEPKIDTGVRRVERVERPTKSDLILVEPVREKTPSASNEQRISKLRGMPPATPRRGLDESQLGKRLAKRVRAMYKMLEHVDHYQLLGLEPNATQEQITGAYFEHSLEFHPDRFFLLRSGDLKEKIYEIFRHVGLAYRVLSDPRARKKYDVDRAAGVLSKPNAEARVIRPTEGAPANNGFEIATQTREAERFVRLASEAIGEGDLNGARLHLHLALTYERQNGALQQAIAEVAKRQKKGSPERA